MDKQAIGLRLRELRGDRQLIEIAIDTGLSISAISNYEQGLRVPRDDIKLILARYYDVSIDYLFFGRNYTQCEDE